MGARRNQPASPRMRRLRSTVERIRRRARAGGAGLLAGAFMLALLGGLLLAMLAPGQVESQVTRSEDVELLARVIAAEARGEPYTGKVAVGAVILNRIGSSQFPNSLSGVVYQPLAFESVMNGLVWRRTPTAQEYQAARDSLNGWDPTYGSLFFWNPAKPVNPWIWSRPIVVTIGNHVFAH